MEMMNTPESIKELLQENDCVIVPGLGGFVANYAPASYSGSTHITFTPPSKSLVFNAKLSHNDGLLIDFISVHNNVTFNDAKLEVIHFVTTVKKQLKEGKTAVIPHIGTLLANKDGHVEFEPSLEGNLLLDSFGFSGFTLPVLAGDFGAKRHVSFNDRAPVRRLAYRKYARRAMIAVPIALVIAALPTLYFSNAQQSSFSFWNEKPETSKVSNIVSPVAKTDSPVEKTIDERTDKRKALAYVEPSARYHIIVGCFKNIESAQRTKTLLEQKGFTPQILEISGFFKVSASELSDNKLAREKLAALKLASPSFPDAWIMKTIE